MIDLDSLDDFHEQTPEYNDNNNIILGIPRMFTSCKQKVTMQDLASKMDIGIPRMFTSCKQKVTMQDLASKMDIVQDLVRQQPNPARNVSKLSCS